ncbi:MAG: hypothetical protein ACTSWN_02175 [Promethearchaeota archaeon]
MVFGFSIITTTGYPYYNKDYKIEPRNTPLKMLFFDYSRKRIQSSNEDQFELIAGLISALFSFSQSQNRPIRELIYMRPEYEIQDLLDGQERKNIEIGTLITVRTEFYSAKSAVKKKLDYIYNTIIKPLEPLSKKTLLAPSEEKIIQDILLNVHAKGLIRSHSKSLDRYLKDFIKSYKTYGVKAVAISTADIEILKTTNVTKEDVQNLLRTIGSVPEVEPLLWKFRQCWIDDNQQVLLTFINSAFNVVYDTLAEPLYYIIISEADSVLGDLPRKLFLDVNSILEK